MDGERDRGQGYQPLPSPSAMFAKVESILGLSTREAAQMFRVSRSTVKRWRAGTNPSGRNFDNLVTFFRETQKLTEMIIPERLPLVIRRPAPMYDGESALDLILKGELGAVVKNYQYLLSYPTR